MKQVVIRLLSVGILSGLVLISYGAAREEKEGELASPATLARKKALSQLFRVIIRESPEEVQKLVNHLLSIGGDVNAYNETAPFVENALLSRPPLLYYVADHSLAKCKILIKAKADPNVPALGGWTSLHRTAFVIKQRAYNQLEDQHHIAADKELEEIFKFLIGAGANPYSLGRPSNSPITATHTTPIEVLGWGHPELVKYAKDVSEAIKKAKKHRAKQLSSEKQPVVVRLVYGDHPARDVKADSSGMPILLSVEDSRGTPILRSGVRKKQQKRFIE